MTRSLLGLLMLSLASACSPQPRSASFFAAHPAEAERVARACADGSAGGQECVNALDGQTAAKDDVRLKLYRKGFE